MKFTNKTVVSGVNILANDHYVAVPYNCTELTALATDGIIKEGTIIPANDETAIGVLLNPVNLNENPNGTIVVHGFINSTKLETAPTSEAIGALGGVVFTNGKGVPITTKFTLKYDLNGVTGTAVTDSSSPYTYGTEVTVKSAPAVTGYPSGTPAFDKWNTKADGTGTSYAASAKFNITENMTLYAIYKA